MLFLHDISFPFLVALTAALLRTDPCNAQSSLRCYSCNSLPLPRVCDTFTTCAAGQYCQLEKHSTNGHTVYHAGCRQASRCPITGPTIVGRAATERECCTTDFCNNQGFGLAEIPSAIRGPYCLSCSYQSSPEQCKHVTTCKAGEVCTIEAVTFPGSSDVFYNMGCKQKTQCTAVRAHAACDGSCCEADYCNDRCVTPATTAPTIAYSDVLRTECLKLINQGYFYDSYSNLCVRVVKTSGRLSQEQAYQQCANDGAELIAIKSRGDQDLLLSIIFSHQQNDTDFWIGAHANVSKSHVYYWSDGSAVMSGYTNWQGVMMGQPDDRRTHDQNCVFLNDKDMYFWHDDVCTSKKTGYICEITNTTDKVHTCRSHVFDGFYYDIDTDMCIMLHQASTPMYTHAQAETACEALGASLITVDLAAKTDFILRWIFTNHENATDFWIGAKDIHDNSVFYWPNGKPLGYSHWGHPVFPPEVHGQPDALFGDSSQDCVYMDYVHRFFWFDEVCSAKKSGFICDYVGSDAASTRMDCRGLLPQGYFYDEQTGLCIRIVSGVSVNQVTARGTCQSQNADLVTIDNSQKMDFVLSWIFFNKANDTDFWIGGKDIHHNNEFFWEHTVRGSSRFSYTHWYTVTPPPPEDCAILEHVQMYTWKPQNCRDAADGYICQINQYTIDKVKQTCAALHPADIVFVFDSSGSENIVNFQSAIHVASNLASRLDNVTSNIRYASVTYSSGVRVDFNLQANKSGTSLQQSLQNVMFASGASYTDRALHQVSTNVLTSAHGDRKDAENIVLVFTDGASTNPTITVTEAASLHNKAFVMAVGIGQILTSRQTNELKAISSLNTVYPDNDLQLFQNIRARLANHQCTPV